MDPVTCLENILRGPACDSAQSVEDLISWLRSGGFAPKTLVPVDCRPLLAGHQGKEVTATTQGIERRGQLLFAWSRLRKPEIKVYRIYLNKHGYATKRGELPGVAGRYFGVSGTDEVFAIDNEETGDRLFMRATSADEAAAKFLASF